MASKTTLPIFLLALALAGCPAAPGTLHTQPIPGQILTPSATPGPVAVTVSATPAPVPTPARRVADLVGTLVAPAGLAAVPASSLVSDQTGSLVSDQTGSLVSDQTGSIVSDQTGSYRTLLAVPETSMGKTTVYLADAVGRPVPGLRPVETDATGKFTFVGVPAAYTFQVVAVVRTAGGQLGRLTTLARPGDAAAISAGSTLVTSQVVATDGGALGTLDVAAFGRAVEAARAVLVAADLPDFADRVAVAARGQALGAANAAVLADITTVRTNLTQARPTATQLQTDLGTPTASAVPASPLVAPTADPFIVNSGPEIATCTANWDHEVILSGTYTNYPLTLTITVPGGGTTVASGTFIAPGQSVAISFPEACRHDWILTDNTGKVLMTLAGITVLEGAPKVLRPAL